MSLSILIHVTHLLGAGHLTRAASLASACGKNGHAVTLLSGGMPNTLVRSDGFKLVQLPPVKIEGTAFTRLLTGTGEEAGQPFLAKRRQVALDVVRQTRPDVVVTELFPFGRRILAEEFTGVIKTAHRQTRPATIIASIRDILATPSRPERVVETHRRIVELYDAVLVHGDPDTVPLDASWPVDDGLRSFLHYTGYIDNPLQTVPPGLSPPAADIVVSGGSSPASLQLYRAALTAAEKVGRSWHVLVGNGVQQTDFETLSRAAPANVLLERARPDFRALLAGATLSISQCGYNTAVDLLRLPIRRLLIPFEAGDETEQRLRAEILAARGLAAVLEEGKLNALTLSNAVSELLRNEPPPRPLIRMNGAQESVRFIETLRQGSQP